ncbi:MAG: hypothetical protein QW660_04440 [Candidatus Bathyarchaeia archaeon]
MTITKWASWHVRVWNSSKPQLEKHGFKVAPDVYDLRNWDEIRNWAKELAKSLERDIIS